jgi:phage terminase large subunit GpA-like protein
MSGEPACKVFVDERDRMDDSVEGEGDPVTLADARHETYPDGQTVVFSTPTMGNAETVIEESGLEFFDIADEVTSATWKLWQEGTRYHWAVPCPECDDFFIPRFKLLVWPEGATPVQAKKEACLACPNCGALIEQFHKDEMNLRGVYVAPGQTIEKDGTVLGDPPEADSCTFWVSGLMSTWKTWGDRASKFLLAVRSGDVERIQAVINTQFGELYSVKGEAPDVEEVKNLRQPYKLGELSPDAKKVFLTVDVQKNGLYYTVRGWGADLESWLVDYGKLDGRTDGDTVWELLEGFKDLHYAGLPIDRCFIDSGYRTQFVYAFCRKYRTWAFPTKGKATIDATPLQKSRLDVATTTGKRLAGGLGLWMINTDYFKRWVHERIERDPTLPGGFHLPEDASADYCKQLVSEARIVKPSGKIVWAKIYRDNHYFDCEVLQVAAAYSLNLQSLTSEVAAVEAKRRARAKDQPESKPERGVDPFRTDDRNRRGRGSGGGSGWFSGGR